MRLDTQPDDDEPPIDPKEPKNAHEVINQLGLGMAREEDLSIESTQNNNLDFEDLI